MEWNGIEFLNWFSLWKTQIYCLIKETVTQKLQLLHNYSIP